MTNTEFWLRDGVIIGRVCYQQGNTTCLNVAFRWVEKNLGSDLATIYTAQFK